MSSKNELITATPADGNVFRPYLPEFLDHLTDIGVPKGQLKEYPGPVKHFLLWLSESDRKLEDIDDDVLRCFRDHECGCRRPKGELFRLHANRKNLIPKVRQFVRFLEISGRVSNPSEIDALRTLLAGFLACLQEQGLAPSTVETYRFHCDHLVVWLRQQRIPIEGINSEAIDRFATHDCICERKFLVKPTRDNFFLFAIRRFVRYLIMRGVAPGASPIAVEERSAELNEFRSWLQINRGIRQATIQNHLKHVAGLFPYLGRDPAAYDARSIKNALLRRFESSSRVEAQHITVSLRMYLRFLASNGRCASALAGAIPSIPRWRLSTLPRYILSDDVDRVIASCDVTTPTGLRDRAVLLLLARLALRGGDVFRLRLGDIDWDNSVLRVSGKSRRSVGLPLPQDAGDALLSYIEHGRPRVPEDVVFLRAIPPYEPFATSGAISIIVRNALKRAGIRNQKMRGGAYLLRHSAATNLLRSGATLDAISSLLRHRSIETTTIYAKVDTPMLQSVVQPWIGDVK